MTPDTETKICRTCGVEKPKSQFNTRRLTPSGNIGLRSKCKTCAAKRIKELRIHRRGNLRRKYGITLEQHDALLEAQNGRCAICKGLTGTSVNHSLAVDHDHVTGRVRGLLCHKCNFGIGLFQDNPELLKAATEYLEKQSLV